MVYFQYIQVYQLGFRVEDLSLPAWGLGSRDLVPETLLAERARISRSLEKQEPLHCHRMPGAKVGLSI